MTWSELLAQKRVAAEPAHKQELDDLRAIVKRSLHDAGVASVSADGRFGFAYNAARTLATMVVRAAGYRVKSHGGGHYNTFLAVEAADPSFAPRAAYFDTCREKRNESSYTEADVVTDTETEELIRIVTQFRDEAEAWVLANRPDLAP